VVAWNLGGNAAGIKSWKTKTWPYKSVRRAKRAKRVKKFWPAARAGKNPPSKL
jgi:hypothetical protein